MIREEIREKVGIIYLDRPDKLNALNFDIVNGIEKTLRKWENNEDIRVILFDSTSENSFSAGGDLSLIYAEINNDKIASEDMFFVKECRLNKYIMGYKKPVISHWHGITMGGGVGLTIHSDLVITDETTKWAMPETRLGFVPDMSVGKYISNLPQALGQFVGLCGPILSASDLVENALADSFIEKDKYDEAIEKLFILSRNFENEDLVERFKKEILKYEVKGENLKISEDREKIEKYFSKDSLEEIFDVLNKNQDDKFARKVLKNLKKRPIFMLALQFEKYFLGKKLSLYQTIDLDLKIIFYAVEKGYIKEGIKANFIYKNYKPSWIKDDFKSLDLKEVKKLLVI